MTSDTFHTHLRPERIFAPLNHIDVPARDPILFGVKMKCTLISASCIIATIIISGIAYLKGHRDGSVMADLRSLSYELPILESLGAEKNDEARNKLTNLVSFRSNLFTEGISIKQSWSYWSGVDEQAVRADVLPRTQQIIKRLKELEEGYLMEDVNMNNLMGWLAKKAGMQYFHNPSLNDSKYAVTGHMNHITEPKSEIDGLASAYDLHVQIKNNTLYLLTTDQYKSSRKIDSEKLAVEQKHSDDRGHSLDFNTIGGGD